MILLHILLDKLILIQISISNPIYIPKEDLFIYIDFYKNIKTHN